MLKFTIAAVAVVAVLAIVAGALTSAGANSAEAGAAPKATGGIEYFEPGYFFNFNAHEAYNGRPAKGEAWNFTPSGGWYQADVDCVVVDGDMTWFAAELVDTNMPSWGPWVLIKVHDGGTPGTAGDLIWGEFMSEAGAISKCNGKTTPAGGPWDVLSGNLVVH